MLAYACCSDMVAIDLRLSSFFSLYNSPYPAHRLTTALDIYYPSEPLFPFEEGRVIDIRRFRAPRKRADALGYEPLILIQLTPATIAKILHVEPRVRVGERIYYGDPLGTLIVSGYMYVWSEKHMHVELRPIHDRLRARGAYRLRLLREPRLVPSTNEIKGVVAGVESHYILVKPSSPTGLGPTPLAIGALRGKHVFLEGGYPHYGYVGLIGAGDIDLGVYNVYIYTAPSKARGFLDRGHRVFFDGVSTYFSRSYIKLVSRRPISGVKEGDYIEAEVAPGNPP